MKKPELGKSYKFVYTGDGSNGRRMIIGHVIDEHFDPISRDHQYTFYLPNDEVFKVAGKHIRALIEQKQHDQA